MEEQMNLNSVRTFLSVNAPAIFTGMALVTVVETVALTVQATVKVQDEIHDLRETITVKPEPEPADYVKACWKHCVPPACTLTASLFFIIAANQAHVRKEASLAALYSLYESKYKSYREKNRELFGDDKDAQVSEAVLREEIRKSKPSDPIFPGRPEEYLVYDELTRQYFYATMKEKEHAQEQLNRILCKESAVAYNYLLALFNNADHKTKLGNIFGWFMDDTFAEYYYWNESFYGRPYAELTFEPSGEVTDQQEEIYILRCSLEPVAENDKDDSEDMDARDKAEKAK